MPTWLIIAVLEALGFFLLWNGERGGDEVQSALGGILVVSVTALFLFRLVANFLTRRHSGKEPPTRAALQPFVRLKHQILLGPLLSPWSGPSAGRRCRGEPGEGPVSGDGIDFDLGGGDG